jgi:hypothetical protein
MLTNMSCPAQSVMLTMVSAATKVGVSFPIGIFSTIWKSLSTETEGRENVPAHHALIGIPEDQ